MDAANASIVMVTQSSPQNELFLDYLRRQLECDVSLMASDAFIDPAHDEGPMVVLLDDDHLEENDVRHWLEQLGHRHDRTAFAAFNMADEDRAMTLLMHVPLQGVFYRNDPLSLISKGIVRMLEGEMWLSRPLMERLLTAYWYRQYEEGTSTPLASLTPREREILGMLDSGASNQDIADRLMISEHTVKSHLYHVFRKLKVRNRTQALHLLRQQPNRLPDNFSSNMRR
ncbi:LuxR family transcriptional regulator of csgAB operon [Kushneria sinocarnis]|uniref:LuxR family transcriptional regulator of csgAB operon n=1 Tax=Kushneria sinocarnis TaxID=595502 RepID=A0A420X091_9GAMM|nr:response regulator transcription factor [Kushneria sinocarnis]RKR07263.1 LuxR family transcriptional regulator of csgAB operon [Kushneria sinocarnis]